MSANLAVRLPERVREVPQRRIEIVSTRSQRKSRPKPLYAIIVVSGLFVVFMVQLLLSIVVSDGAYTISSLQTQRADLSRTAQSLNEEVDVLASTQNLATQAESLGMVLSSTTPAFLDLATGKVVGKSKSTATTEGSELGGGGSLVPNALIDGATPGVNAKTDATTDAAASGAGAGAASTTGVPAETAEGGIETGSTTTTTGAPTTGTTQTEVPSSNSLPVPITG